MSNKEVIKQKSQVGRPEIIFDEKDLNTIDDLSPYLSIEQISNHFMIGKTTWYRMVGRQPEILERYKKGKAKAIREVSKGLLQQARDGDKTCAMFYLKTQAGWCEKTKIDHTSEDGSMSPKTEIKISYV